jgi:CheY-like chemotaxis protein
MIKKVLIVDDDQQMLLSLKEGLEKYDETFSVVMAADGATALEKLKKNTTSVVVTDLKMPNMDGFTLLSHIMEDYPEIPVIIITGYSTPQMEKLAGDGGAVGYIEKPFVLEELAKKVITALRKESEGGTLHSVSSGMFLQLVEMEQKTCTIRLVDKASGKQGVLYFRNGELLDARLNGTRGEDAAYEIFSWDEVNLSIQNTCAQSTKRIRSELQAILLEAMRLKDERVENGDSQEFERGHGQTWRGYDTEKAQATNFLSTIRNSLETKFGDRCGLKNVCHLDSWDGLLAQMTRVGNFFDMGRLKLVYLDRGESTDFILLPHKKTAAVSVYPNCPRERIIQVLTR